MKRNYPPLHTPFVTCSYGAALLGGFLLAAYLSVQLGGGWWSGALLFELIQLHGHLQLVGWMGMLLIGVSLFFIPRLMSSTFQIGGGDRWIFLLLFGGLVFRAAAVLSSAVVHSPEQMWGRCLLLVSTMLEAGGVGFYVYVCLRYLLAAGRGNNDLKRLWPYFGAMLCGWLVFVIGQLYLSFSPMGSFFVLLHPQWSSFLSDVYVRLVLIPAIFGFGVKMIPVFMGLTPPLWPVRNVGLVLVLSTFVYLSGKGFHLFLESMVKNSTFYMQVEQLGLLGVSLAALAFIWYLDALLFRILPERIALKIHRSDVSEQRGRFGDRGEYGRFELFIIAGFAWLAGVALLEGVNALCVLSGRTALIAPTTLRHGLLLGALAHLVLGVSHRLLPGLLGAKLLTPWLTIVSFCFLFVSSLLRVIPPVLLEIGVFAPKGFFSWSGPAGLLAVLIASVNIFGRRELDLSGPTIHTWREKHSGEKGEKPDKSDHPQSL